MPKSSNKEVPPRSNIHDKIIKQFSLLSRITRFFKGTKAIKKKESFSETIKQLKFISKNMSAEEKDILNNFLKLGSKTVEDVMIPRSDISAVRSDATLETLNQAVIKFSHTRTLVYEDTLDNITGFVHIKDLFKVIAKNEDFNLKKIIRKPIIAAPSMKLIDLLAEMQKKRTHIAVVVDEYGGTAGISTIEDIMEEIVGRMDDEHDNQLESDSYKIVNPNTILASARVEVEELERILGTVLKEEGDEFDTIGGLILAKVGHVPLPGTKLLIAPDVEVEVIDANPRTLKQVKLTLHNKTLE